MNLEVDSVVDKGDLAAKNLPSPTGFVSDSAWMEVEPMVGLQEELVMDSGKIEPTNAVAPPFAVESAPLAANPTLSSARCGESQPSSLFLRGSSRKSRGLLLVLDE